MPLSPLFHAAAAAACLVLAVPAWGAVDKTASPFPPDRPDPIALAGASDAGADQANTTELPAPPAEWMDEARGLIDAGRFAEALNILEPLVSDNVIEANALFLYGLAAMGAARQPEVSEESREALLNEAIGAFHTMLLEEPDLLRVRLELARAFYLKGEDDLVQRHFILVLGANPPATVVANVRRFLLEIEGRGRWSYRLGAALAPDSNIGGSSDERTIYIFNLPFERDVQELTTSGIGASIWGGAEYQQRLNGRLRLRAGAEFARREYERSQFDQLFVGTRLGPRFQVDENTGLSVLASARQRWLGTAPDTALRPSALSGRPCCTGQGAIATLNLEGEAP